MGGPQTAHVRALARPDEAGDRSGIIAFHHVVSDDGKSALVEFVFHDRSGMAPVLTSLGAQSAVKVFQKGKDTSQDIEATFKALKKDFDFDKFIVRVP